MIISQSTSYRQNRMGKRGDRSSNLLRKKRSHTRVVGWLCRRRVLQRMMQHSLTNTTTTNLLSFNQNLFHQNVRTTMSSTPRAEAIGAFLKTQTQTQHKLVFEKQKKFKL